MGKLKWYKRDPVAALEGMSALTNEECGAYNRVLDLIYARDGNLRDDDRFIAGWCRCDVRVWRRIKMRLLELNKLYIQDGLVRNERADVEVHRGLCMVASVEEQNRIKGLKSGAVRRKNKELAEQAHEPTTNTTTTTTTKKRKTPAAEPPEFAEFWASIPKREGANPRLPAVKAYVKAIREGADPAQMNAAAKRWARDSLKTEPKFISMAVTWLNQKRFEDYHASAQAEEKYKVDHELMRQHGFVQREDGKWMTLTGELIG